MIRTIADAFHNSRAVAWIVTIAKGFRQRFGVDHYGIVGVVGVNRYLQFNSNYSRRDELLSLHYHRRPN